MLNPKPKHRTRRRVHYHTRSMQERCINAAAQKIVDSTYNCTSLIQLKKKLAALVSDDRYWSQLEELIKVSKKLGSLIEAICNS